MMEGFKEGLKMNDTFYVEETEEDRSTPTFDIWKIICREEIKDREKIAQENMVEIVETLKDKATQESQGEGPGVPQEDVMEMIDTIYQEHLKFVKQTESWWEIVGIIQKEKEMYDKKATNLRRKVEGKWKMLSEMEKEKNELLMLLGAEKLKTAKLEKCLKDGEMNKKMKEVIDSQIPLTMDDDDDYGYKSLGLDYEDGQLDSAGETQEEEKDKDEDEYNDDEDEDGGAQGKDDDGNKINDDENNGEEEEYEDDGNNAEKKDDDANNEENDEDKSNEDIDDDGDNVDDNRDEEEHEDEDNDDDDFVSQPIVKTKNVHWGSTVGGKCAALKNKNLGKKSKEELVEDLKRQKVQTDKLLMELETEAVGRKGGRKNKKQNENVTLDNETAEAICVLGEIVSASKKRIKDIDTLKSDANKKSNSPSTIERNVKNNPRTRKRKSAVQMEYQYAPTRRSTRNLKDA